jgi:hypothetical protein
MTDARQPVSGAGTPCPDFESLSCYADGELEPALAAGIAAHVDTCSHCVTLAGRLREGLAPDDARRDGGIGGSGCAGEERLVVYAAGGMSGAERAALHAHLGVCDPCVSALAVLHRRLSLAAVVDTPVPSGVQQRARLAFAAGLEEVAPAAERARYAEPRGAALLERIRGLLRVPVLVPAALAAGALLTTVALRPGSQEPAGSGELTRAIAPDSVRMRVTAIEATVRSRPSMQSETVATVRRGTVVEVAGGERDWYEVRLDGGSKGWVEREAFE